MICQYGLRALLHGSSRQLRLGCAPLWRTGNLVRNAAYPPQCETFLRHLEGSSFGAMVLKRGMSCVWIGNLDAQRLPPGVLVVPRRSAGHSKWQNIKHVKQANDLARGIAFSKIVIRMKAAIMAGKGTDPKFNHNLAQVIDEAKRINMPAAKIESILKATEVAKALIPFVLEAKGPGGTFMIIELLTDNINRSRNQLKYQLSKQGVTMVDGIRHMFKYKGIVAVDPVPSKLSLETAVDIAIDAGAEDVVEATDDDGTAVLQFLCEPLEVYKVKTALSDRGYAPKFSKLSYIPEQRVSLNDELLELMSKIGDILDNHPDVDKFFDNVE